MTASRAEVIAAHVAVRSELLDSELLAELEAFPALAAGGDATWRDRAYLDGVAARLVALAHLVGLRRLRDGADLVCDRAGLPPDTDLAALAEVCLDEVSRRTRR